MRPAAVPGNSPVSGRRSLPKSAQQRLANVIAEARRAMVAISMMSAVLNVLLLGGSLYMMGVYDMVLPSHSVPTLVGLATLVLVVYIFQGIIDFLRSRALLHFSATVVIELNREIHRLVGLVSRLQNNSDGLQPVRDLDQLRGFLSSQGPTALVDLPWILFFGGILFLLHPYLGMTVLLGGLILVGITLLTEKLTSRRNLELVQQNTQRMQVAETTRRHVEVIVANGMQERIGDQWITASNRHLALQDELSSVVLTLGNSTKVLRMALQSAVLTVGALLVLQGEASGGVIFAASILSSRALAPVEAAIGNWRSFVGARQSWKRLKDMLAAAPTEVEVVLLPPPQRDLAVENLALSPPGSGVVTLHGISFRLHAGEAMAILGPSGSGKSSLVRGMTGIWPLASGSVRLDGAELTQWPPDALGCHIGYVPQNVELIDGTIAQNISRFDPHASPEAIIEAATLAGVHDLVLHLPQGYNSDVGTDGRLLSGGQRQRIALARAMYGNPFLIVLDEPNSNLDQDGEDALAEAIAHARKRGAIVVVVAHRPSILHSVDLVLILSLGQAVAFGPTAKLVPQLIDNKRQQKETA